MPNSGVTVSEYYKQSVYDTKDNKIGDVNDVLLDKDGQVSAVILGVGGFLGIGEKFGRLLAHQLVLEDVGIAAVQLPGTEQRTPVDERHNLLQRDIGERARAEKLGAGNVHLRPVENLPAVASLRDRQ